MGTSKTGTSPSTGSNAIAALLGLVMALFSGVVAAQEDAPVAAAAPAPAYAPAPGTSAVDVNALLDGLVVGEPGDGADYDREAFHHWIDADKNGCDTRQEILIAQSVVAATVSDAGCRVLEGEWLSIYDGKPITDPRRLDIDHMVPLKEAWISGASAWTPEEREAFANDLDEPSALLAVTASTNRSKADRDPARWRPPAEEVWCDYAIAWVNVKTKWSLTVDANEVTGLAEMLATCDPEELVTR